MKAQELLAFLSIKYKGDFVKMLEAMKNHERVDEKVLTETLSKCKEKYITVLDEGFPQRLKNIYKAPIILWYRGDISLINDNAKRYLSVAGTRDLSDYGRISTAKIIEGVCKDKNAPIIVSGLAKGVDTIAHARSIYTMNSNSKTIAVVGNGLDMCYPLENASLQEDIIKSGGLVISEYPNGVAPEPNHFPMRNRIIAGLGDVLFVPEGKIKSGTAITCSFAKNDGKKVLAIPHLITEKEDLSNLLIKCGDAELVQDADDILSHLPLVNVKNVKKHLDKGVELNR